MLSGEGMGLATMKKVQLIKRLTNQSHNLQVMAVHSLTQFLADLRDLEEQAHLEYIRKWKAKDRVLRRIMDDGLRLVG
jgi:hypothetical protein